MKHEKPPLDLLVEAVGESAKYRHVSPNLVRRLGQRELTRRRSLKEAVKETKNTLHQVAGAYLDSPPRYDDWLQKLNSAQSPEEFREACRSCMALHASTRERAPFLETFYQTTLASLGPIRSVIDIACGLNPLAISWMPLEPGVRYDAYDLYGDMMAFLYSFLAHAGRLGSVEMCDVVASPPMQVADLALILKFLPVLEQTERGSALSWLKRLRARNMLISFPTHSLGGRGKGMAENYEAWFREMIREEPWEVERFTFPSELCFLVKKSE